MPEAARPRVLDPRAASDSRAHTQPACAPNPSPALGKTGVSQQAESRARRQTLHPRAVLQKRKGPDWGLFFSKLFEHGCNVWRPRDATHQPVSTCALAERADKPGSVVGRPFIFCLRCRRPHSRATRTRAGPTHGVPICPFSGWGLPSRAVTDALVRSYRTVSAFLARGKPPAGVFFSVALSVGSPRPAVSRHPALWSPDFPHRDAMASPARPSGPLRQEGSIYQREGQSPSRWYPQL